MICAQLITQSSTIPTRHSNEAAGCDIHADSDGIIQPKTGSLLRTGIMFDVPSGHVGLIYGRSGLSNKYWLEIDGNCIHPGHHDEVIMYIFNNSDLPFQYVKGDRVAQIVFVETGGEIVID